MEALDRHAVAYPTSDGERMAENTLQYEWIVRLVGNLDALVPDFVAGDLLWYPVEGEPKIRVAPDALVCLGRPKGHRGAWLQWQEDNVAPQVVIEVLSPGNTIREMPPLREGPASDPSDGRGGRSAERATELAFYNQYGVQEFILLDPMDDTLQVVAREDGGPLEEVPVDGAWTSGVLGVRFELGSPIRVFGPDGTPFLGFGEILDRARSAEQDAARAQQDAARAQQDAARARDEATAANARAEALAARLRAAGIDPEA